MSEEKLEEICLCGQDDDPDGKLPRLDIVCPKHDGVILIEDTQPKAVFDGITGKLVSG